MTISRTHKLRGVELSLAIRLYLLLAAICVPAFLLYYAHYAGRIAELRERQIQEIVTICRFRLEDWLYSLTPQKLGDAEREQLGRELKRIVEEPNGVDGITLFEPGSTAVLRLIAAQGPYAPLTPSVEDEKALLDERTLAIDATHGGEAYRSVSIPLRSNGKVSGTIHMEISPDRAAPSVSSLRRSSIMGAIQLMLAVGIGVVCFFHYAVGLPVRRLTLAMQRATDGDLSHVVPVHRGELGRLGHSYNQMMLQLRSSMEQNRRLIEQASHFNDALQVKVKEATEALEAKHDQLQTANEKLFSAQRHMTRLEKLASLGQVSTILAHELGTPLNAISGHLQLMAGELMDGVKTRSRLLVINEQVDRLTGIVRDVLDTMRMPPPKQSLTDLPAVIQSVVDLIAPMAQKQGIALCLDMEPGLPSFMADSGQIEQLLMNLFTNAMDAMKDGGTLTVSTAFVEDREQERIDGSEQNHDPEACWLRVDVTDTGAGIPPEIREQAFEPFFTTKKSEGGDFLAIRSGLGMGLSICRQIVKNHQGDISMTSEPGKGTRFRIYFPLGPARA